MAPNLILGRGHDKGHDYKSPNTCSMWNMGSSWHHIDGHFYQSEWRQGEQWISERGGIHDEKRLGFLLHYMELYTKTVHFIEKAGIPNQAGHSMYGMQHRKGKKGGESRM